MTYMWSCCSLCYYFIGYYLIYLPGNVYKNTFGSSGSEMVSVFCGGIMYSFFLAKKSFFISFTISLVGGLLILMIGNATLSWMPVYVILAKFGISSAYCIVYAATMDLFPTLFSATAFGICNFIACIMTILAPYLA